MYVCGEELASPIPYCSPQGPRQTFRKSQYDSLFYSASTISSKLDGRGIIKKDTLTGVLSECLRKERDSNPRCLSARRFSRPVYSTTLPSFLTVRENWLWSKASAKVMPFFDITKFFAVFFIYLFADADRKSTRLNSSHIATSRMPSSA